MATKIIWCYMPWEYYIDIESDFCYSRTGGFGFPADTRHSDNASDNVIIMSKRRRNTVSTQ